MMHQKEQTNDLAQQKDNVTHRHICSKLNLKIPEMNHISKKGPKLNYESVLKDSVLKELHLKEPKAFKALALSIYSW